ncbi:hypothetical protein ACT5HB_004265, partial [Klebsiella pneumoniae]
GSWKIAAFQFIGLFARFAGWYFFFKTADLVACREENQTDTIWMLLKKMPATPI